MIFMLEAQMLLNFGSFHLPVKNLEELKNFPGDFPGEVVASEKGLGIAHFVTPGQS